MSYDMKTHKTALTVRSWDVTLMEHPKLPNVQSQTEGVMN